MKFKMFGKKEVHDFKWEQVAAVASAVAWGFNTPEAFAVVFGWPNVD